MALVAVALFAVALAAFIGNFGLTVRLDDAARARLTESATLMANLAATNYTYSRGWTAGARAELGHLAALDSLRIELRLPNGHLIEIGPKPTGVITRAAIMVHGQKVATVLISTPNGNLLTTEEQRLRYSVDQLHLIAAGVASLAAIVVGIMLAQTLTRPLRHIRTAAERLEHGDLGTHIPVDTEPEMGAVGRALNRLAETLQHEEELRKESVADLSHELRTPVNGLLSRIEAAQDGVLPLGENLAAMHVEVLRLAHLLDDLARLAEAEQPGLFLDKQQLNLVSIVEQVSRSFVLRFADAGIDFFTSYASVWVFGDARRLEQVVINLLSNALCYTERGGQVVLTVARSTSEAIIEVTDTGVGIDPRDLDHIFTRFWRADRSRSRATGGTGIGLTIVHKLVQAHGGRIEVKSAPGQGSCFRVILPAIDV